MASEPSWLVTTGRFTTTPVPRIADCGRKTTGVSKSAPRERRDVEFAGIADDGSEQASLRVDRDADVLLGGVDDVGAVDRGVDDRVGLQCFGGREREERQEGELVAGLREEVALHLVAKARNAR